MKQGLSKKQMDEIAELASLRDEVIEDWDGAVVDWLKKDDRGYQRRANKLLVL
jgi:uncharacterized protein (DUF4415 family)